MMFHTIGFNKKVAILTGIYSAGNVFHLSPVPISSHTRPVPKPYPHHLLTIPSPSSSRPYPAIPQCCKVENGMPKLIKIDSMHIKSQKLGEQVKLNGESELFSRLSLKNFLHQNFLTFLKKNFEKINKFQKIYPR